MFKNNLSKYEKEKGKAPKSNNSESYTNVNYNCFISHISEWYNHVNIFMLKVRYPSIMLLVHRGTIMLEGPNYDPSILTTQYKIL